MTSFPLYNNIIKQIDKNCEKLTEEEKKNIIINFKKCSKESHELIYALIRYYQIDNENEVQSLYPYNAKKLKSGIKFDLNNIPIKLQKIISKFIDMDLNKN